MSLTRRAALLAAAAAPFAPALLRATPARAEAPLQGPSMASFHRFALGGFEVTTLLVGARTVEKPQEIFGLNVDAETFGAVSAANFGWQRR